MTPASATAENCHDTLGPPTINTVTGRSGKGTARQTFRYDADKWEKLGEATEAAGTDRTALIRDYLDWVMGDPDAPEPARLVQPPKRRARKAAK